jgi:hypothetical protein
MDRVYLMPEHIEFLNWLIDYWDEKYSPDDPVCRYPRLYAKEILKNGYYPKSDSSGLNKMVSIYKQQWLWRNTGPVQRRNKK